MTVAAAPPIVASQSVRDTLPRIAAAGLAGGAVDLLYASGMALANGGPATQPWQAVASGWIGRDAAQGGAAVIGLGVATHFAIAACMAAAYVLLARPIPAVVRRPYATAVVYGLVLYGVMNLVVLPLRWPDAFPRWAGVRSGLDILAHIGVALAFAWVVARPVTAINPKSAKAERL